MFLGLLRIRGMECRQRYAEGYFATKVLLDIGDDTEDDDTENRPEGGAR
jgi:hypothetical protein